MTTETITEYETVEKQVEMSICDECGTDIGPVDGEDTHTVPVLADPQFDYDREQLISKIDHYLARHSWEEVSDYATRREIEERDRGYVVREGWVKWDDIQDILDHTIPTEREVMRGKADAMRELCPNCARKHGFEVGEDGSIDAMVIRTPDDKPEQDDHVPESYQRLDKVSERFADLAGIGGVVGVLAITLAIMGAVTIPASVWAAIFMWIVLTTLTAEATDPVNLSEHP